jgi:hypothetical protein
MRTSEGAGVRQRRFEYFWIPKCDEEIFGECASRGEASRRGQSANLGSKFRKRSPLKKRG